MVLDLLQQGSQAIEAPEPTPPWREITSDAKMAVMPAAWLAANHEAPQIACMAWATLRLASGGTYEKSPELLKHCQG